MKNRPVFYEQIIKQSKTKKLLKRNFTIQCRVHEYLTSFLLFFRPIYLSGNKNERERKREKDSTSKQYCLKKKTYR